MKAQIQVTLLVAAALYMGWGLTLALAPGTVHPLLSLGPYDSVTTAMFGAALLGMMATFVIAAYDPERESVGAFRCALRALCYLGRRAWLAALPV